MINLDATKIQAFIEGGATVESADKAFVVDMRFNYGNSTLAIWVNYGAVISSVLTDGLYSAPKLFVIDLTTGDVKYNSQIILSLTANQLLSIQNTAKNLRNNAETFLINSSLVLGTTTAW